MSITTGRQKIGNMKIEYDVVIIGSGAGGAVAASYLASKGYSSAILEEGPYVTYEDFNQNEKKLVPMLYRRSAGLSTDNFSVKILQGRVWGGSTTINWQTSLRTPNIVLDQWVDEFGLEEYEQNHMEKHFEIVEKRLNVEKVPYANYSPQNHILHDGCIELGIHTDSLPNNSKNCIGCGSCGLGCYYDAKQDMRLTYLKDAYESGLQAYTDTRAEKINYLSPNRQIITATLQGEKYGNHDQVIKFQTTRVIVAAGSIYTPLILQNSSLTKSKSLGKFFQIHPTSATFAEFDREINPYYGIPQAAYSKEYINYDNNGYGWWLEVPDLEPFLVGLNYPEMGINRREGLKKAKNSSVIIVIVRDGANKKSNGEIKWRRGFNIQNGNLTIRKLPSIRYNISQQDKYHLLKGIENAAQVQFAAGAKQVLTLHNQDNLFTSPNQLDRIHKLPNNSNEIQIFSAHPMGTARMGTDLKSSVVGPDLQMHQYPGVYVMDGSILPTALGVNPMITILSSVSRGLELGDW